VKDVWYGPGGEMTQMKILDVPSSQYRTETRQYNELGQLTRLTVPNQVDLEYFYRTANNNNGQIERMKDHLPGGEEIAYQYDELKRLVSAGSVTYGYDGFGNRTSQNGQNVGMNAGKNRVSESWAAGQLSNSNCSLSRPGREYNIED
jgi:uncharacterized protein RhaS with RHS repeats